MARATSWFRWYENNGLPAVDRSFPIAVLEPGETIGRVRLGLTISSAATNNFPWGRQAAWGLSFEPSGGTFPSTNLFYETNDPAWLWWEGLHFDVQTPTRDPAASANLPTLMGPVGRYRDVHAMRKVPAGLQSYTLWFQWGWFLDDGPPLYTFLTSSTLIIESAVTTQEREARTRVAYDAAVLPSD